MELEMHNPPEKVIAEKSEDAKIFDAEEGNLTPKGGKEREGRDSEGEKIDCVIDVKRDESFARREGLREKVCRICHLGSSENIPPIGNLDMIQLGCGCKDELGFTHLHCAETWFKQKGNRKCEICGKTAKNINVVEEDRLVAVVQWNESNDMRLMTSERESSCLCKKNLCNILLACLVLAFVLPWFIRIDFVR